MEWVEFDNDCEPAWVCRIRCKNAHSRHVTVPEDDETALQNLVLKNDPTNIPSPLGLAEEVAKIPLTNADVAHLAVWLISGLAVVVILKELLKECWLDGQVRKEKWEHEKVKWEREQKYKIFKIDAELAKWEAKKQREERKEIRETQERRELRKFELEKLRLLHPTRTVEASNDNDPNEQGEN